jgi:plastocyanin
MARASAVVVLLVALAGCGGDEPVTRPPPTPLDPATTGTITGTVTFDGRPPAMGTLNMASEAQCAAAHAGPVPTGDVLVKDGKVENAFVWIKDGLGDRVFPLPTAPVVIDQKGCVFTPRVAGAQTGQPIHFLNSDPLLHNVHSTPAEAKSWNLSLSKQGVQREVRVAKPEVMIPMQCDVHPWMRGYLGVLSHPYFAVTGADGKFVLPNVPAGQYVVGSWHERFGTREARVAVTAQETKDVGFAYGN